MTEKEFISFWKNAIKQEGIKNFPDDFLIIEDFEILTLPGKTLVIGQSLFGAYEILTTENEPVLNAKSYDDAKFIIYSNRMNPKTIKIPAQQDEIKKANKLYENYVDSIIKRIEAGIKSDMPENKNQMNIIAEILRSLILVRY
ncbi:MAG: hypothetical protein HXY49_11900 [Ignavibacteriaceae bacterium]|nr:hypothetical protein [Ignavibacteriaceae bacterium]